MATLVSVLLPEEVEEKRPSVELSVEPIEEPTTLESVCQSVR